MPHGAAWRGCIRSTTLRTPTWLKSMNEAAGTTPATEREFPVLLMPAPKKPVFFFALTRRGDKNKNKNKKHQNTPKKQNQKKPPNNTKKTPIKNRADARNKNLSRQKTTSHSSQNGTKPKKNPALPAAGNRNFRLLNETFYGPGEGLRISLGLVDLSRIPSEAPFREVKHGSEMASQNDQNKEN